MSWTECQNVLNLPEPIEHRQLERLDENSVFKSKCPTCKHGALLMNRDATTLKLIRTDNCILCGQKFLYVGDMPEDTLSRTKACAS